MKHIQANECGNEGSTQTETCTDTPAPNKAQSSSRNTQAIHRAIHRAIRTAASGTSSPATTSERRRLSDRRWSGEGAAPPVNRATARVVLNAARSTATMLLVVMTWASTFAPQYRMSGWKHRQLACKEDQRRQQLVHRHKHRGHGVEFTKVKTQSRAAGAVCFCLVQGRCQILGARR
jgi:hypothetical protein